MFSFWVILDPIYVFQYVSIIRTWPAHWVLRFIQNSINLGHSYSTKNILPKFIQKSPSFGKSFIGRNILSNRTSSGRGNKIRLQLRLCTYKQAQVVAQLCNKANAVCKFIFQRAVEVLSKSEIIICNASWKQWQRTWKAINLAPSTQPYSTTATPEPIFS